MQERGLYFLDARDPRYVELLSAADPFPKNPGEKKGMLVEAPVGRGTLDVRRPRALAPAPRGHARAPTGCSRTC